MKLTDAVVWRPSEIEVIFWQFAVAFEFCTAHHSLTYSIQHGFPMGRGALQSGVPILADRSTTALRKNCSVDHDADLAGDAKMNSVVL